MARWLRIRDRPREEKVREDKKWNAESSFDKDPPRVSHLPIQVSRIQTTATDEHTVFISKRWAIAH